MFLNHLRQASWLSGVLRILVLCFALGTLTHAGHTHELSQGNATQYHCDYCTSFGGLIDPPVHSAPLVTLAALTDPIAAPARRIIHAHPVGIAQPRAPPSLLS